MDWLFWAPTSQPATPRMWVLLLLMFSSAIWLLPLSSVTAQTDNRPTAEILSPGAGEALLGSVVIQGSASAPDFRAAHIEFGYAADTTDTWFLITTLGQPVREGSLANWDTTTLTDGIYTLRLTVLPEEGEPIVTLVPDVRIRNYTPVETSTPAPTGTTLPTAEVTPVVSTTTIPATGTPLPPNSAQLTSQNILQSLARGGGAALGLILLVGAYLGLRGLRRRASRP